MNADLEDRVRARLDREIDQVVADSAALTDQMIGTEAQLDQARADEHAAFARLDRYDSDRNRARWNAAMLAVENLSDALRQMGRRKMRLAARHDQLTSHAEYRRRLTRATIEREQAERRSAA